MTITAEQARVLLTKAEAVGDQVVADLARADTAAQAEENARLRAKLEKAVEGLESIAGNTCCEGCQEAARVAHAALAAAKGEA